MPKWTKLPPLPAKANPCGNCPPIAAQAPMDKVIAVGFGSALVLRNGEPIIDGERRLQAAESEADYATFAEAEKLAAADPDNDWRVELHGPLHGETYQRHDTETWVLVETNQGFA